MAAAHEQDMARQLLSSMSGPRQPAAHHDVSPEWLAKVIPAHR